MKKSREIQRENVVGAPAPSQPRVRTVTRMWWMVLCISLIVGAGVGLSCVDWTSTATLFAQARTALESSDFELAEQLGRRLMARSERHAEGLLITGEATCKLGQLDAGIELLNRIPETKPPLFVAGKLIVANIQCDELGRPTDAEPTLREALKVNGDSLPVHEKLSFILGLSGRSWEAVPHRLVLIQQEGFPLHHLSLLALGSTAAENPEMVASFARKAPDDVLVKCAQARIAQREERIEEAERRLDEVIRSAPNLFVTQAWRGEMFVNRGDGAGFQKWHEKLPAEADGFPDIWFVRGIWALKRNEPRVAVRCFWECLQRDANHQSASYHLANVLSQLGEQQSAQVFREHAKLLNDLITAAKTVEITGSPLSGKRAAAACDALGLKAEARAWREVLRRNEPRFQRNNSVVYESLEEISSIRMDPKFDPTRRVNLAAYPLPTWKRHGVVSPLKGPTAAAQASGITFADLAKEAGIAFTYRNGSRPESESEYMYEFSGGGVAVLDFDLDGWPDLYFTQGSDSPPGTPQEMRLDRLFRSLADVHVSDVTSLARIHESGFSQGCTVGDFDNDGFPDLYAANIGPNRFFHNNGDGTFADITTETRTAGDRWTTSCVLADFNGDGMPDLFATNYLTGKDLFTNPCRMQDGSTRLCTPHEFQAAHDQLYINLGDGRFEDQSSAAGIEVPEGKGLGVVAATIDGSPGLSLFIANDAVPNFYFANRTSSRGSMVRFEEQAFATGLAVDADGQPQACMGVAAGDANGDGLLDIFVTNFRNESNTLYLQQPGGLFVDATRPSGLREPSFEMLGFGTQFLDADLDGWEDLILTNGHVGNLKHHGVPYEMPPQFFRNLGGGRFTELPASTLGPFFAAKHLGRGLARLDWNRDGREDFLVSHLKSPVALLANQTPDAGNFLTIQLRGTESDRDAIGARVTITAGGRQLVKQLTAGDGYQASNQRQLVFGLGKADQIERLEVQWPTGKSQVFSSFDVNTELMLIEGQEKAIRLVPASGR